MLTFISAKREIIKWNYQNIWHFYSVLSAYLHNIQIDLNTYFIIIINIYHVFINLIL